RLRQTSTSNKQVRPWRPDLNETASTKPGAIQCAPEGNLMDGDWCEQEGGSKDVGIWEIELRR
ncbi:hypothetical protein ACSEO6_34310, partial [Pseudomonas aeruginosa]